MLVPINFKVKAHATSPAFAMSSGDLFIVPTPQDGPMAAFALVLKKETLGGESSKLEAPVDAGTPGIANEVGGAAIITITWYSNYRVGKSLWWPRI